MKTENYDEKTFTESDLIEGVDSFVEDLANTVPGNSTTIQSWGTGVILFLKYIGAIETIKEAGMLSLLTDAHINNAEEKRKADGAEKLSSDEATEIIMKKFFDEQPEATTAE